MSNKIDLDWKWFGVIVLSILMIKTTITLDLWWVLIISGLVVGILVYIVTNLLSQINQLEKYIDGEFKRKIKKEEDFDKYYQYILGLLTHAYSEMSRIDKRGSFSSDDEVGFSFRVIYRSIEELKQKIESMKVEEKDQKE